MSITRSTHSGASPGQRGRQVDVLGHVECRDQVERLEHEADAIPPQGRERLVGEPGEIGVADPHRAARDVVEACEAVHQRRLAGSGRAHDRGESAGGELHVDAVEPVTAVGPSPYTLVAATVRAAGAAGTGAACRGVLGSRSW